MLVPECLLLSQKKSRDHSPLRERWPIQPGSKSQDSFFLLQQRVFIVPKKNIKPALVSYTNRDASWNAYNRHLGSVIVDTVILFSNLKSPSHEC